MNPLNLNMDRYTKPTTDAPHELAEAVNLIMKDGIFTRQRDYGLWLKRVADCKFDHPVDEITRLLQKAFELKVYFQHKKGEPFNTAGWLTNRLKEQARGPQPRD